jgi:hypothetical protein
MADEPPDRLCIDPSSRFYDEAALARGVGVRFKGRERDDVEEYCVSEGWIRAPVGKTRDRKGNLLTIRFYRSGRGLFRQPEAGVTLPVRRRRNLRQGSATSFRVA